MTGLVNSDPKVVHKPRSRAESEILLDIEGVNHNFGDFHVLHDVNLEVARGDIVGLVGPSGCGKSTLLRAIIGTHPPRKGTIKVEGQAVEGPGRDRGIVYQHYSLFPFLTALDNVAVGPLLDKTDFFYRLVKFAEFRRLQKQHREEAAAMLERFGLGHALNKYPHQLSGGMKQRVAIAQALIMRPALLVLDEPFGALDEATREDLQDMLVELFHENLVALSKNEPPPHTIVIVTHELNEALYVSNRVVGLSQYWDYESEGHAKCPGATVIYDRAAPVTTLGEARDPERFVVQRHEIRDVVFQPERRRKRSEFADYWAQQDLAASQDEAEEERAAELANNKTAEAAAEKAYEKASEPDSPSEPAARSESQ